MIVMLNLLIAIISDTFEKVMAIEKQAELYEKFQLILNAKRNISKRDFDSFKARWERVYLCLLKRENSDEADNFDERLEWKIENLIQKSSTIEAAVAAVAVKADNIESRSIKTEGTLISMMSKLETKITNTEHLLENILKSNVSVEYKIQK